MFSRAEIRDYPRKGGEILFLLQAHVCCYKLHHVWEPVFSKVHSEEVICILQSNTLVMYRGPVLCFRVSDDHNSTQMALTPIGSPCPTAAPGRDEVTMYNDCEEHLSGTRAHMKQTFSIKVFQK